MTPTVALTIAGSDSGGGAGIQADLKTFAAFGVYGASAITALTAQNTLGVRAIHPVPAEFVVAQVDAVLEDLTIAAAKTGMLATAEIVRAVADMAAAGRLPNLVVDPVMVASSGDRLLEPRAERLYLEALIPQASVLTPNVREAEVLLGASIRTPAELHEAARALGALGPSFVVVKGGHPVPASTAAADDVVWNGKTTYALGTARIDTANTHGTGCTFAAATAAAMALGADARVALERAKVYVTQAIRGGVHWQLGRGHGPLDHFGWASGSRPITSGAPRLW